MTNFDYYAPTKVVFGKGTEDQVGELVKEQGCTKVLVHYGSGSVKRSGLLDRIFRSLEQAEIPFVSLGGVVPNPRLSLVYQGIELCKKSQRAVVHVSNGVVKAADDKHRNRHIGSQNSACNILGRQGE